MSCRQSGRPRYGSKSCPGRDEKKVRRQRHERRSHRFDGTYPIGKAYRGAFNDTEAPVLGGHVIRAALNKANVAGADVDDVILGIAAQQGTGLQPGASVRLYRRPAGIRGRHGDRSHVRIGPDEHCHGCQGCHDRRDEYRCGRRPGVHLLVQNKYKNSYRAQSKAVLAAEPTAYIQMIETAELVSQRYGISREAQDEYSLRSQQRVAAAQARGLFDDEIVPLTTVKQLFDKEGNVTGSEEVTLTRDEGNRADTTLESLAKLKPGRTASGWSKASSSRPAMHPSCPTAPAPVW
jgi:acetyl-CoA C-acetyltransferase